MKIKKDVVDITEYLSLTKCCINSRDLMNIRFILFLLINCNLYSITVIPFNSFPFKNYPGMIKLFILLFRDTEVSNAHTSEDEGMTRLL